MSNASFLNLVNSRKRDNLIIVVFADSNYLEVLLNWLVGIHRLGISNYVIVSLDSQAHEYLSKRNFPSYFSLLEGNLSDLWVRRIQFFHLLAANGINFIHSDADALWLKNPITDYFNNSPYQLFASEGTIWPPDILEKRGFVLCCGLLYMQSHPQIAALLEQMLVDVKKTGDDQITINRMIESPDIHWHINQPHAYNLEFKDKEFLCCFDVIEGTSPSMGLKFGLLPHHLFQRVHMPNHKPYVKHLVSPKTCENKMEMFRKTNCLFLKEDWRQIEFDESSIANIAR